MSDFDVVLNYWFGESDDEHAIIEQKSPLWWSKNDTEDAFIREHFSHLVDKLEQDQLASWSAEPQGHIARIIVADQFTRVIFRDTAKSYAYDDLALQLAEQAVTSGLDKQLKLLQRLFCYLPYEHAESMPMQDKCVELMQQLADEISVELQPAFQGFIAYAERHRDVIARFGRFPHRNQQLGRESTEEELLFLQQPGSSF